MRIPDQSRFFHSDVSLGADVTLEDDEFRHAKVLRLQPGDEVQLVDGKGSLFLANIIESKKRLIAHVVELLVNEPQESNLSLAIAPTKNVARIEMVVEKATEIGIARIVPIQCEQSERSRVNTDRLKKIAVSAMKQSEGLWLPEIEELQPFSSILSSDDETWLAHCVASEERMPLSALIASKAPKLVAIGPEGDFSPKEIREAKEAGFNMLDLGNKRLRTETAALVVCLSECF